MTRICIIGDSHLAAIKLGWDAIAARFPDVEICFLGATKERAKSFAVSGSILFVPNDIAGGTVFSTGPDKSSLPLEGFDHIIAVGLGLNVIPLFRLYRNCRSDRFKRTATAVQVVSPACYHDLVVDLLKQTKCYRLAQEIAKAVSASVWIVPQPYPSPMMIEHETRGLLARILASGDEENVALVFDKALDGLNKDKIVMFKQPPQTRSNPLFTDERFSKGSFRLAGGLAQEHPNTDFAHMNADYGAIVMTSLMSKVLMHE